MKCWRLCKQKYASNPLDGEGARLHGGRWNQKGDAVVYCSSSLSLAVLETLVHLDPAAMPRDLVSIEVETDDALPVDVLDMAKLPADWRTYPAPDVLRDLGSNWVRSAPSSVLIVPSAVVPKDRNYLINPSHPDAARISARAPESFVFDPRLLP